jgi:hypothetical protein
VRSIADVYGAQSVISACQRKRRSCFSRGVQSSLSQLAVAVFDKDNSGCRQAISAGYSDVRGRLRVAALRGGFDGQDCMCRNLLRCRSRRQCGQRHCDSQSSNKFKPQNAAVQPSHKHLLQLSRMMAPSRGAPRK